jgi:hypothetical protein
MSFISTEWRSASLGAKLDECPHCHRIDRHDLVREVRWLALGPIGVLPIGVRYGMTCSRCEAYTRLPRRTVTDALRTGTLQLPERARPGIAASAVINPDSVDRVTRGGGLDGSTVYLVTWAVVLLIAVGIAVQPRPPAPVAGPTCLREKGAEAGKPLPASAAIFQMIESPCDLPHNFEVLQLTDAPFDVFATYPPDGDFGDGPQATCESAYQGVFGQPSAGQNVQLVVFGPDPVAWIKGDRKIQCTAWDLVHPWVTGSWRTHTVRPASGLLP